MRYFNLKVTFLGSQNGDSRGVVSRRAHRSYVLFLDLCLICECAVYENSMCTSVYVFYTEMKVRKCHLW